MKVYRSIDEFKALDRAVATTGTFDGVHLGHQKILQQLVETARRVDGESVLLTFDPHPRKVLQPDVELYLLQSVEEKIQRLEATGLDHLIIHPFTKEFSRTKSLEFVREILVNKIGVKHLVIGYDHHFGRNREGSFDHLKEFGPIYGFDVQEIDALDVDEVNVSSTKIRQALQQGDVERALDFLGHPYTLCGRVVKGEQVGRTLGFPTANLALSFTDKLLPAHAVYAGHALVNGQRFKAMANIGSRPTLAAERPTIEVHLFDFEGDLYGQDLVFELHHKLRGVQRFDSLELLQAQLAKDKEQSLQLLA